ncbi:hypothetical protein ACQKWADRAFT_307955 [Trichoderma austrokoningii]
MVYPGSDFANSDGGSRRSSHRSGGSESAHRTNSGGSASSNISVESAKSASKNIMDLARVISIDLKDVQATVKILEDWADSLDLTKYKKRNVWTPEMERAYERYKECGKAYGRAHQSFEDKWHETQHQTTPEQHVERAKLAIAWGEAAERAADARARFMITYRDAYKPSGIETHIQAANNDITSAKRAVDEARRNYAAVFIKAGRAANPEVFR